MKSYELCARWGWLGELYTTTKHPWHGNVIIDNRTHWSMKVSAKLMIKHVSLKPSKLLL